jgi:hypothetical protein
MRPCRGTGRIGRPVRRVAGVRMIFWAFVAYPTQSMAVFTLILLIGIFCITL